VRLCSLLSSPYPILTASWRCQHKHTRKAFLYVARTSQCDSVVRLFRRRQRRIPSTGKLFTQHQGRISKWFCKFTRIACKERPYVEKRLLPSIAVGYFRRLDARYAAYAAINFKSPENKRANHKPHNLLGDAERHMPINTMPHRPKRCDCFPLFRHSYPGAANVQHEAHVHSLQPLIHILSSAFTTSF